MNRLGKIITLTAGCAVLACLAGCNVEVAGDDLARVIGEHASAVKIDPDAVAKNWSGVTSGSLKEAAKNLASSEVWGQVSDRLAEANEDSDGPVRDALVQTACDAVQNSDLTSSYLSVDLQENLEKTVLHPPQTQEMLETVNDLAATLSQDYQSGSAGKATVAIGCAANAAHGTFG
jgi:hypothetical protein